MGLRLLSASSFVFNPTNKTIDFSAVSGFTIAGLQLIRNENIVMYGPAQPYASLSINGSVVTLGSGVSTTGMNANDPLTIYYDDSQTTQPVSGTVTANVQAGGTALSTIAINSVNRLNVALAAGAVPGSTAPNYTDVIGGTDGTNARAFLTDTTGRQLIRPQEDPNFTAAVTASLTAGGQTLIVPMAGFNAAVFSVSGTFSGANITFFASYDGGTNYTAVQGKQIGGQNSFTSNNVVISSTTVAYILYAPTATHIRVTLNSISSGSVAARLCPYYQSADTVVGTGTNPLFVALSPIASNTAGNPSVTRLLSSVATTNATSVKASAGRLYKIVAYNSAAVIRYIKVYNKASAPTVGTDTPIITLVVPALSYFNFDVGDIGYSLGTGIAFAITGAGADADTTAIAAGDIVGMNVFYF